MMSGVVVGRKLFEVIHEDADLRVINEPAGLVCHPTKADEYSSLQAPTSGLSPSAFSHRRRALPFTILRLFPLTGWKHQIRIHLAHVGRPIVGDKLYGRDEELYVALVENRLTAEQRRRLIFAWQALHVCSVRFHWRGEPIDFSGEPEP